MKINDGWHTSKDINMTTCSKKQQRNLGIHTLLKQWLTPPPQALEYSIHILNQEMSTLTHSWSPNLVIRPNIKHYKKSGILSSSEFQSMEIDYQPSKVNIILSKISLLTNHTKMICINHHLIDKSKEYNNVKALIPIAWGRLHQPKQINLRDRNWQRIYSILYAKFEKYKKMSCIKYLL